MEQKNIPHKRNLWGVQKNTWSHPLLWSLKPFGFPWVHEMALHTSCSFKKSGTKSHLAQDFVIKLNNYKTPQMASVRNAKGFSLPTG